MGGEGGAGKKRRYTGGGGGIGRCVGGRAA